MQDFGPSYYNYIHTGARPRQSKLKKAFYSFASFGILALLLFWVVMTMSSKKQYTSHAAFISPLGSPLQETSTLPAKNDLELQAIVTDSLSETTGTYAIYIQHLQSGDTYIQNENKKFWTASLYKLWVMATAFRQIEEGKLTLDTKMSDSIPSLNARFDIASESAEQTEGNIALTVEEAINRSITVSHNYPAMLLTTKLRISTIKDFLSTEGLTNSEVGGIPQTTAVDIARFYEKLYKKELISKTSSDQMLAILKKQQLNDRIPKYLPKSVQVAHKTGELEGYKHDAGIVFTPKGDYIFIALSQSNNPQAAAERMALLSQRVYEYFGK